MTALPRGTVTFAFADIEGSTALLKNLGARYGDVLADRRRIMRETASTSSARMEAGSRRSSGNNFKREPVWVSR